MRILLVGLFAIVAACGPTVGAYGHDVGGPCQSHRDCARICLISQDHYPGGMCTFNCLSDYDCPGASSCVGDGFCAVNCTSNNDCAAFGRGYLCDAVDRHGAPGGVLVCRVP